MTIKDKQLETESLDVFWMQHAIELAKKAEAEGEVPVGAVIVKDDVVVGEGWNRPIIDNDPTAHAEMMALRAAAQTLNNYRLNDTTLYVTLEPCCMCAGAIIHARVSRVVYGAIDPKAGAVTSMFEILGTDKLNHKVEVKGELLADECGLLLTEFFRNKRKLKREIKCELD